MKLSKRMIGFAIYSVLNLSLLQAQNIANDLDLLWEKAKRLSSEAAVLTKEYSNQGKNILIEQTLLNGINALVDTDKIKVKIFDINDTTNDIKIELFLMGEDKDLSLDIKKFDWGVTKDKKYIVFENFDVSLDIPWMQYILDDIVERDNGYLKVPYNIPMFSLLYSIKANKKTTYPNTQQEPFDIMGYKYDQEFIKIEKFQSKNNTIEVIIKLKGSQDNLNIKVQSYMIRTANEKKVIVLQDIEILEFTKPWLKSIIDLQKNKVYLKYTDKLYKLLQ